MWIGHVSSSGQACWTVWNVPTSSSMLPSPVPYPQWHTSKGQARPWRFAPGR